MLFFRKCFVNKHFCIYHLYISINRFLPQCIFLFFFNIDIVIELFYMYYTISYLQLLLQLYYNIYFNTKIGVSPTIMVKWILLAIITYRILIPGIDNSHPYLDNQLKYLFHYMLFYHYSIYLLLL